VWVAVRGNTSQVGKDIKANLPAISGKAGEESGRSFSTGFSKLVKGLAAGFVFKEVLDVARDAIGAASDLSESVSKNRVVFGASAAAVEAFGATSARSFGISKQAAIEAAATFGNFFEAMGIAQPKAEQMSVKLVGLASDLASFNNVDPKQVLEDLRSGLAGQVEPLRKYGVDLSDTTLKIEAMKEGMVIHNGVLTAGQKAQVAYSLILAQTGTAQGDFARTSGGLANQQRILSASWDNAKAALGEGLLPIMTRVVSVIAQWIPKIIDFVKHNKTLVEVLAGLAAAVWVVNIALAANPIGLVVAAVAILIGGIVFLAMKTRFFETVWAAVSGAVINQAQQVARVFTHDLPLAWDTLYQNTVRTFVAVKNWIVNTFESVVGFVSSVPSRIWSFFTGLGDRFLSIGTSIVDGIIRGIENAAGRLLEKARNLASDAWHAVAGAIGFGSPATRFIVLGESAAQGFGLGLSGGLDAISLPALAGPAPLGVNLGVSGTAVAAQAGTGDVVAALARLQELVAGLRLEVGPDKLALFVRTGEQRLAYADGRYVPQHRHQGDLLIPG
jgi:hypothetical protein